jgi:hypothetical protein
MAMSKSAQMLKDRMKKKSKKDDKQKNDEMPKTDDLNEETVMAELEKVAGGGAEDEEETEVTESVEMGAKDDANMAGGDAAKDPVKVFADVLELDDVTAQAVYGEAMAMPELADMSPDQMAKKIDGNYDMLKKIMMSMGEKAALAMKNELNQPMDVGGEMGGVPAGPDMGGPPMGAQPPGDMAPM